MVKNQIDFIIKQNKFLGEHVITNEISEFWSKHKHGNEKSFLTCRRD